MGKIREVVRLILAECLSRRRAGAAVGVPYATVAEFVTQAKACGFSWPLPEGMDDRALEERVFPSLVVAGPSRPEPDWAVVHREPKRPGVTLLLPLWIEYKERNPDGHQYSQFCLRFRKGQKASPGQCLASPRGARQPS
jgi:transposase